MIRHLNFGVTCQKVFVLVLAFLLKHVLDVYYISIQNIKTCCLITSMATCVCFSRRVSIGKASDAHCQWWRHVLSDK